MGGYIRTKDIAQKCVEQMKQYKKTNKVSKNYLAKQVGCGSTLITRWLTGAGLPSPMCIYRIVTAGVSDVRLPDDVLRDLRRNSALGKKLMKIDDKNRVPSTYVKHRPLSPVLVNQMALLIDNYVLQLGDARPYAEFQRLRSDLIRKICEVANASK